MQTCILIGVQCIHFFLPFLFQLPEFLNSEPIGVLDDVIITKTQITHRLERIRRTKRQIVPFDNMPAKKWDTLDIPFRVDSNLFTGGWVWGGEGGGDQVRGG